MRFVVVILFTIQSKRMERKTIISHAMSLILVSLVLARDKGMSNVTKDKVYQEKVQRIFF